METPMTQAQVAELIERIKRDDAECRAAIGMPEWLKAEARTVRAVMQLLGIERAGAGFWINWEDAQKAGRFDKAKTIGGYLRGYCRHVCRRL